MTNIFFLTCLNETRMRALMVWLNFSPKKDNYLKWSPFMQCYLEGICWTHQSVLFISQDLLSKLLHSTSWIFFMEIQWWIQVCLPQFLFIGSIYIMNSLFLSLAFHLLLQFPTPFVYFAQVHFQFCLLSQILPSLFILAISYLLQILLFYFCKFLICKELEEALFVMLLVILCGITIFLNFQDVFFLKYDSTSGRKTQYVWNKLEGVGVDQNKQLESLECGHNSTKYTVWNSKHVWVLCEHHIYWWQDCWSADTQIVFMLDTIAIHDKTVMYVLARRSTSNH